MPDENHVNAIAPGDIVEGLLPDQLAEVLSVRRLGENFVVKAIGCTTPLREERVLTPAQFAALRKVRGATYSYDGHAEFFLLGAEAERIRVAYQFDPLFAVNASIVDPLPHQVEAVYRYLLTLPRIRFLLADDTGAGKTIMTGLLIKELLFRGVIQKILIITPGGLTKQWKEEELEGKFGLNARLVNRLTFEAEPDQFARSDEGIFVTSIDFLARNEACLKAAAKVSWDLVVVDEAHKLSAYEYGTKVEESERYKAVKALAPTTTHLLFLTATPHRGRKDPFRRLLALLDEDLFQTDEHVTARVREQTASYGIYAPDSDVTHAPNHFFLRRLKEEMVDWNGQPLFKSRFTKTLGYDLTPEEKNLYDQVTRYVRTKRIEARKMKNRNVELTLMILQRRLASSLYAITRSLENRLRALNEVLELLKSPNRAAERKRLLDPLLDPDVPRDITEYEELSDEEREQIEERIFRQVLTDNPAEITAERDEVQRLLQLAQSLKEHKEAKFEQLLDVLDSSNVSRSDDEKLLIFTEYRDTLESITKRLEQKGYVVATIHGGMDVDARKQAQRTFRTHAKIMVATDAAGEGINLQFCRWLINWDIPWNPNRLEQRMGRIHRYGQKDDVWVFNLVARNTREGAVLERVLAKLDIMREQMGSDRVYDVIDELLEDVPLAQLIEEAIDDNAPLSTIAARTDTALDRYARPDRARELIALEKSSSLASHLDLRAARELRDASDEHRLQPMFIQRFFERAWRACGGTLWKDSCYPVWHLDSTPSALIQLGRELRKDIKNHYKDIPFVFDKQYVSVASPVPVPESTTLLGPGHPLFDTLIEWAIRQARPAFVRGALLVDPSAPKPQRLWLIRSSIRDSRPESRQLPVHQRLAVILADDEGKRRVISPSYLLNCLPPDRSLPIPDFPDIPEDEIRDWAYNEITARQLKEFQLRREEECRQRREYLDTTFRDLILSLSEKLNNLQGAQLRGEDTELEQRQLKERIRELQARRDRRLQELELMRQLQPDLPELLTAAIVLPPPEAVPESEVPAPPKGLPMRRDDEVEAIAMQVAMEYERRRGWHPTDVSQEGEHYDIRSEGPNGEKRFIEVKGRAQTGPIVLTAPELDKLRQLGERAWLYIVTFCKGQRPRLHRIQDPISKLTPEMLYRQVQYLVDENQWSQHCDTVADPD